MKPEPDLIPLKYLKQAKLELADDGEEVTDYVQPLASALCILLEGFLSVAIEEMERERHRRSDTVRLRCRYQMSTRSHGV